MKVFKNDQNLSTDVFNCEIFLIQTRYQKFYPHLNAEEEPFEYEPKRNVLSHRIRKMSIGLQNLKELVK